MSFRVALDEIIKKFVTDLNNGNAAGLAAGYTEDAISCWTTSHVLRGRKGSSNTTLTCSPAVPNSRAWKPCMRRVPKTSATPFRPTPATRGLEWSCLRCVDLRMANGQ